MMKKMPLNDLFKYVETAIRVIFERGKMFCLVI